MGITLIFVSQWVVTDAYRRSGLLDFPAAAVFQEIAPHIRPYPKPTQVDW